MPFGSQKSFNRLNEHGSNQAEDEESDDDQWIHQYGDWLDEVRSRISCTINICSTNLLLKAPKEHEDQRREPLLIPEHPRSQSQGPLDYAAAEQSSAQYRYSTSRQGKDTTAFGPHYNLSPAPAAGGFLETASDSAPLLQHEHREGPFLGTQDRLYAQPFTAGAIDLATGSGTSANLAEDHHASVSTGQPPQQPLPDPESTPTVASAAVTEITTGSSASSISAASTAVTNITTSSNRRNEVYRCDGCDRTFASLNDVK